VGRLLYRIGELAARRRWPVLAVWAAVAVALALLVGRYGSNTSDDLRLPGADSQAASDLLASRFPPQQNGSSPIVFHVPTGKVTDAATKQAIEASRSAILQLPHVYSATDPFGQKGQAQVSKDGTTAFVPVLLDVGSSELTEEIAGSVFDAADPARAAGLEVAAGGPIGSELSEPSTERSEAVGLIAAMVILVLAFGSVVAMGMPIATAIVGLAVGLSGIALLGHVVAVPSIAPTLATMIGLGVGIDYALFLVSRHRTHMRDGMDAQASIPLTVATSGSAVVYAGGTVVIALLALGVAQIPLVTSLGYAAAVAVATAVLASVTLLPALLSVLGTRVDAVRLPAVVRPKPKEPGHGLWSGWARLVTSHPRLTVLAVCLLVVPLTIPAFSLRLGQEDIGATPASTTQRQAYDLVSAGFGVGFNGPLLIAVQLGAPAAASGEFEDQLGQAQGLQASLEQEQSEGTSQKDALTKEAQALDQQQQALERQQAGLEQQADELTAQQASLRSQATALEQAAERLRAQQQEIVRRQKELTVEAVALAKRIGSAEGAFERNRVATRVLETQLARTPGPREQARLRAELRILERRGERLRRDLASLRVEERELRAAEAALRSRQSSLRSDEDALAASAVALAKSASALAQESAVLLQQKQELEQEASALQVQAANLQTQQAQLEGLQQQAQTNQQQAEQLQAELTQELTKAGGDERGTDPRLVSLQDGLVATPGVTLVSPPQINGSGTAATYSAIAATAPASPDTADLVRTIRSYTIPQATQGTDVEAHVGGVTASNVDLAAAIGSRLGLVIAVVIALSFLVLLAAYRSLVIPAQAALVNVLAVVAAFGVLTAVFQWGWGLSLVGIDTSSDGVPVASYVPLMTFAVLFGLSMDYQVFLLSQLAHQRGSGLAHRDAVAAGLAAGARVVVPAALIMIAVFGSFVLNGDPIVKQFGVGLSAGVALAAFLVLTLAPAILVIVGRASWWLPDSLGRRLPHLDIEGEAQHSKG
jgi:uncharacterized membrane protein YdfJ with MMPL/SSD domain